MMIVPGKKGKKGFVYRQGWGHRPRSLRRHISCESFKVVFLVWQTEHISMLQNAGPDISASDRETEVMNIVLVLPMVIVSLGIRVG